MSPIEAAETVLESPGEAVGLAVPVWAFVSVWLIAVTGAAVWFHHGTHGVVSGLQAALAFFLAINILITWWEIALYLRIDLIEERWRERAERRARGERRPRATSFFLSPVPVARLLSPTVWSNVWSEYANYDPSYADRKSFGFAIDVGNGFSTLLPSLIFLVGMTWQVVPPVALGIIGGLLFYQKFYGTLLYFFTYVFNRRYEGQPAAAVWTFVGGVNGIWLIFPAVGLYVCFRLIWDRSFAILLG